MLTGDNVVLRPPAAADADALYELAADLDSWEERVGQPPRALTRELFDERFDTAQRDRGADQVFVIESEGLVAGQCELFGVDHLARVSEVGIALLARARGRGLGTDAMRVLVEFAFTRLNLHRVHLSVLADNAAAVRSYLRVGFVQEGRRRESAWVRGQYVDEILMGLLRSEWAG
ncbi:GNAT family N-acetyltransferase [Nakamurella sp. YIM 132087]|uniref:GNAT family N-acetyltransferase n=1 Tax=Nakamurella alba TaxID=2665158 RepID=A0A7K1FN13_9ACTN|nr:GNAT family protein [Nakamurella alba]MTD15557.1 GNAT family N-acetyltransferase [Nakamurella alba]